MSSVVFWKLGTVILGREGRGGERRGEREEEGEGGGGRRGRRKERGEGREGEGNLMLTSAYINLL